MIAKVQHISIGNEVMDGVDTIIDCYPASGYVMIDVIVKGYSKNFNIVSVDNTYGRVVIPNTTLVKGDCVTFIYKQNPAFNETREFSAADFLSTEFA